MSPTFWKQALASKSATFGKSKLGKIQDFFWERTDYKDYSRYILINMDSKYQKVFSYFSQLSVEMLSFLEK